MSAQFLKYYRWMCIATFELIVLGGIVRKLNAGRACPDWPLCFGDIIPEFHPQVYLEFIHRVIAGGIGLGVLGLNGYLLFSKKISPRIKVLSGVSFVLLISQIVMGGLTVLLQLKANVVTAHLALGTGLFGTLIWIYFSLQQEQPKPEGISPRLLRLGTIATAVIYIQILLGGTVATNYAALVCTDFPLCHGHWIPTLHGIIGLQVIHRLSAYLVFVVILSYCALVRFEKVEGELQKRSHQLLGLLFVQMALGISNVVYLTPPLITASHLATATALLAVSLRSLYLLNAGEKRIPVVISYSSKVLRT